MRRGPLAAASAAAGVVVVVVAHATGGSGTPSLRPLGAGPGSGATAPLGAAGPGQQPSVTTSPPRLSSGAATGALEQYGYGQLAVKVTVSGGKITDLLVTTLATAEQYSQQLAAQVIPMLRNEVLSAQSARINAVSGATYTSEAYAYSVQSALDKLHA